LNYNFSSDGKVLNFTVSGMTEGFCTYEYSGMPPLKTKDYNYVVCRVKGTSNARWSFRLFFQNGSSNDFPYRQTPSEDWTIYEFICLEDAQLRHDAYLAVKTVDGLPASVSVDYYFIMGYKAFPAS
jgi:hypothetical protein